MAAPMKCMGCVLSRVFLMKTRIWERSLASSNTRALLLRTVDCTSLAPAALYSTESKDGDTSGSDSDHDTKTKPKKKLDLAKPGKGLRPKRASQEASNLSLEDELMLATKKVSESLGGDQEKTESDLLSALRSHTMSSTVQEKSVLSEEEANHNLKNLFSGMRVEQRKQGPRDAQRPVRGKGRPDKAGAPRRLEDIKLYSGPALGIFQKPTKPAEIEEKTFYDELEETENRKRTKYPVSNAFEELIDWTKEGKIWKFPIDNEQGMHEEAKVGFHEHVFLDHLLDEGFPSKGPIRHFMELVVVGLSKNPYLTVQEKHAHVDWFRTYFKDKVQIVDSLLADAKEPATEKSA